MLRQLSWLHQQQFLLIGKSFIRGRHGTPHPTLALEGHLLDEGIVAAGGSDVVTELAKALLGELDVPDVSEAFRRLSEEERRAGTFLGGGPLEGETGAPPAKKGTALPGKVLPLPSGVRAVQMSLLPELVAA